MGMESFFVSVISKKMCFSNDSGTRKVLGYDAEYNCDWGELLKRQSYLVETRENNIIIDSCIDFFCDETADNGRYITLIGCFSCYEYAINKMEDIINTISKKVSTKPMVYIYGETKVYDNLTFKQDIIKAYSLKYAAFNQMYSNSVVIPPSKFYEYIEKQKNPITSIINLIRKKQ